MIKHFFSAFFWTKYFGTEFVPKTEYADTLTYLQVISDNQVTFTVYQFLSNGCWGSLLGWEKGTSLWQKLWSSHTTTMFNPTTFAVCYHHHMDFGDLTSWDTPSLLISRLGYTLLLTQIPACTVKPMSVSRVFEPKTPHHCSHFCPDFPWRSTTGLRIWHRVIKSIARHSY